MMSERETPQRDCHLWEIVGSRITVYHVLQELLLPDWTEARIAELYGIRPEQVAAARAYIFANFDAVMARHSEIETRRREQMALQRTTLSSPSVFERFEEWKRAKDQSPTPDRFPTFVHWATAGMSAADLVGSR